MKIDNFEISLEKSPTQRDFYMAGEEIKGTIAIHATDRVRIARLTLRVQGIAHTGWHDKHTRVAYESVERVLDEYRDLTSDLIPHCTVIMELYAGLHNIGFQFRLPMEAISSVTKPGYGLIRYCCVASLDVPDEGGDNEIVAETEFRVIAYLNLDAPHFRDPAHVSEQETISGVLCKRPKGWIRADLCVDEMGLLPGESCTVRLTTENSVKKARRKKHPQGTDEDGGEQCQCGLISLCQQMDFRARVRGRDRGSNNSNNTATSTWDRRTLTTAVQSYGVCKANCTKGPETRLVAFQIPDDLPPTSTRENGLIACAYFFRIHIDEHIGDVIVPVVIGSQKSVIKCDENSSQQI